jgi:toxin YoeB
MAYKVKFTPEAEDDINAYKKAGKKSVSNKIYRFLEELKEHPNTGTGHPEPLKYRPNCWSRKITKKHRLVYEIQDEIVVVLVISALGHYDDN